MNITVNDKAFMVQPLTSLAAMLAERGITSAAGLAVALNGTAVPPARWASTMLTEGDSIIIFKSFYGG